MAYQALELRRHGTVKDSLFLMDKEEQELLPGQMRLQMLMAPVNPADLNVIEGKYPIPLTLPCTIGNEGIGKVIETAKNVAGIKPGQRVITIAKLGSWCEQRIVHQEEVILVPESIPIETAAMISVNPPTAWRMLHDFVELKPGDWMIQNAANSVVGRAVIHFAKRMGLHTVNIVRREELMQPLKDAGADVVLLDEERFSKTVRDVTNGAEIKLGFNAVGGICAMEIAKSLAPKGCLVTYGAMGLQPLEIPNGLLIFKNISFQGFWLSQWHKQAQSYSVKTMFGNIFAILEKSPLSIPVEKIYPLIEFQQALNHAATGSRNGKILFTIRNDSV